MFIFDNNLFITILYGILVIICIYLMIIYVKMNIKINTLNEYAKINELGKVYTENDYDPILFEKILLDALSVLHDNINIITEPYFYTKSIEEIIKIIPSYITVMKFSKYVYDHPNIQKNIIHNILQKKYGKKYKHSDKLLIPITVHISKFYTSSHNHTILHDLTKSQYIYKQNISKINILIN